MKSLYTLLAFIFFAGVTMIEVEGYEYDPPKIVYGEDLNRPCVADSENMVAYSHYEEGRLQCEKHQVEGEEDVKQRLAELKLAYPVKVKTH
jgi:hypothetical protein